MKFLEKDLEQIIYETDNNLLNEKGLPLNGLKIRQLRIGNYGISDIISVSKQYDYERDNRPYLNIDILELKKNEISVNTFLQAIKYLKGIKRYLINRGFSHDVYFRIMLIGESIDFKSDFIYLTDLIDNNLEVDSFDLFYFTYNIDINGLNFKIQRGYKLADEGF